MAQAHPTRRRRFQFGLGTMLLLVTVFAVWLGWELNFIRARKALRTAIVDGGGMVAMQSYHRDIGFDPSYPAAPLVPFWRLWLGDEPVGGVELALNTTQDELMTAKQTFAEAPVHYNHREPGFYRHCGVRPDHTP